MRSKLQAVLFRLALCLSLLMAIVRPASAQDAAGEASDAPQPGAEVSTSATPPAKDAVPTAPSGGAPEADASEAGFSILPGEAQSESGVSRFELGDTLKICATKELDRIEAELNKPANLQTLSLYLDGQRMAKLPLHPVLDPECKKGIVLAFDLVRDPNDDDSRKAWDEFLGRQKGYTWTPSVALAVDSEVAQTLAPKGAIEVAIAPERRIYSILILCLLTLGVAYLLLVRDPSILRDSRGGPYSLGKSQMAFWGLLVLLAFTGVWAITGTMERIPPQVLILLGISAGTGLGAVVIGASNKASQRAALQEEQASLQKTKAAVGAAFPPESQTRLGQIAGELAELEAPTAKSTAKSFLADICNDGHGMSFHRLQVVIWTLVLGAVFIRAVSRTCSMPEYPETLLTLMGISGGTYLGFKIPEKS